MTQAGDSKPLAALPLARFLDITRNLGRPCDLSEVLEQVINAGRELLAADRGAVFLYDDLARQLFSIVATGEESIRFDIDRGIAGQCARERTILNIPDCYSHPLFNRDIDRKTGYRTKSLIAIPLVGLEGELVGVMQLLNPSKGRFDEDDERLADLLAGHAAVAIQRTRLLEERVQKIKMQRDLAVARKIQQGVFPTVLPIIPGYQMAGFNQPADETGGDIYDVVALGGEEESEDGPRAVILALADATGHGIGPALSVTQFRAMLRMGLRISRDLGELVRHVNNQLDEDLPDNRFVTAFIGALDPVKHEVAYHSAGQGPLLHFAARGAVCHFLPASGLPLGLMPDAKFDPPAPIRLAEGDALILLTDGFYERRDAGGKLFGKDRVGKIVCETMDRGPQAVLNRLLEEVHAFGDHTPPDDDLTALILHRCGGDQ